ncbi:MAG: glycogen debranching enzyme N-terminal domain-containing protein, partial [Candidatus Eisenbacteria bacterium]|nr:glycogen debranching enzyme N-terminal domain-containing protein [Candidatus Eisenbacteria bacterium]
MQEGQDVLASLLQCSTRTWQLTDGRGAIARGTASGAATRRDHALLSVPDAGPRAGLPAVSLLRFDDRLVAPGAPAIELTPSFVLSARRDAAPTLNVRASMLPLLESF